MLIFISDSFCATTNFMNSVMKVFKNSYLKAIFDGFRFIMIQLLSFYHSINFQYQHSKQTTELYIKCLLMKKNSLTILRLETKYLKKSHQFVYKNIMMRVY